MDTRSPSRLARAGVPAWIFCSLVALVWAAPIFWPEEARDALALPNEWLPYALVLVGHPDPNYTPRERPPIPLDDLRTFR